MNDEKRKLELWDGAVADSIWFFKGFEAAGKESNIDIHQLMELRDQLLQPLRKGELFTNLLNSENKSKEKSNEIVEIAQAGEIIELIKNNPDVKISDKLEEIIYDFSDDTLIEKTYRIDKGIEILNLRRVTEDLIGKEAFKDEVKIYCNLCGKGNEKNEFEVFMIDGFPKNICTKCLVSIRWLKPINSERVCDLCGETSPSFRGCRFGKKDKILCPKCLAQFRVININDPVSSPRIELVNRNEIDKI